MNLTHAPIRGKIYHPKAHPSAVPKNDDQSHPMELTPFPAPAPDGAGHEKGLVMKEKAKVFVIDAVDIIWDWLFAHDLLVSIVSSIIGSVFGVWLAFELIQIITKT